MSNDKVRKNLGHVTAYAYYKAGGGTMTETEYMEFMADFGTAAENAVAAKNDAVQAASEAAGSAADASSDAGTASQVAAIAVNKAQEASASAASASGSASTASGKAAEATQGAETATAKAQEASTSAIEAGQSAASASASATAAAQSALDAAASATSASQSAEQLSSAVTQVATNTSDITDLKQDLSNKANIDGSYESMTVGNAEQLISSTYTEDKEPYFFRTSGGTADIGDREEDVIVGGSVVWNQYFNLTTQTTINGITYSPNEDGSITAQGTSSGISTYIINMPLYEGHKILFYKKLISYEGNTNQPSLQTNGNNMSTTYIHNVVSSDFVRIRVESGVTLNNKLYVQVFDLTQMFGSEVADAVYAMEQANTGVGVAWFKKLFPKEYYEYDAGTIKSVEGLQSHDMVGFNLWDEEWVLGDINTSTGEQTYHGNYLCTKNPIPVFPNTQYHCNEATGYFFAYDLNQNFIRSFNINGKLTPSNCYYIKFRKPSGYGTTYKNDICINLSWSGYRNGEYEPYIKHSYPLDSSLTLRGISKIDASGNLYYNGDRYLPDGTVERRYGVVDLGTLNWLKMSSYNYGTFQAILSDAKYSGTEVLFTHDSKYESKTNASASVDGDLYMWMQSNNDIRIIIKDTANAGLTADEFKATLSGKMFIYELATPTTETAAPYQTPQIVDDFGTEEYVIDSQIAVPIPVGHETKYLANLRDKLQHLPDLADSDGYYVIQQTGHDMSLVHFRIPQAPAEDGTYILKATVSGGTPTYTWEVAE